MNVLVENWFFLLVLVFCMGIHVFGHGHGRGHDHAGHQVQGPEPNGGDRPGPQIRVSRPQGA